MEVEACCSIIIEGRKDSVAKYCVPSANQKILELLGMSCVQLLHSPRVSPTTKLGRCFTSS